MDKYSVLFARSAQGTRIASDAVDGAHSGANRGSCGRAKALGLSKAKR